MRSCVCICETAAQEHFLINTTTLCKAFFFFLVFIFEAENKCQRNNKIFNFSQKKRKRQVAHSVSCQLEYSGECLSPFTYKCHLLSSQGLGKVLLSPPWCAWQTFLPRLGDKLVLHCEKVRGNSMHFASGAFAVFFLFDMPLVRCNLCIKTGAHRLCFHFTERWGSVPFEKTPGLHKL